MTKKNCSICLESINSEEADILVMGPYGSPRCLCEDCSSLMNTAATDTDYERIVSSINSLADKMNKRNIDDRLTVSTMTNLLSSYARRAKAIKNGEELPEESLEEGFDEIPEDLRESEEDKALDEEEAKKNGKLNRIVDWICIAALVGAIAFFIIRLF